MKKFLLKFSKSKWSKVFACCLICTVFISMFAISSSAASIYTKANFSFNFSYGLHTKIYCQTVPTLKLYDSGSVIQSTVDFGLYDFTGTFQDQSNSYAPFVVVTDYQYLSVNGTKFEGVTYSPGNDFVAFSSSYSFVGSESDRVPGKEYIFIFVFKTVNVSIIIIGIVTCLDRKSVV